MKLADLEPRWLVDYHTRLAVGDTGLGPDGKGRPPWHGMGVSFLCPHCRDERIAVFFENPIDGMEPSNADNRRTWRRTGATFDDLSLAPSIDASGGGHWHGFIRNGELVDA